MTPRSEAIAFKAWQVASRMGWNCTIREVADEIGVDHRRLGKVVSAKGWTGRFRVNPSRANNLSYMDREFAGRSPLTVSVIRDQHAIMAQLGINRFHGVSE